MMEGWEAHIGFRLLFPQSHRAGDSNLGLKGARQALSQMGYMACAGTLTLRYNTGAHDVLISEILCREANMSRETMTKEFVILLTKTIQYGSFLLVNTQDQACVLREIYFRSS